ncbi:MAG TPA: Gfo/Idh/MocA family oxidoreductase [Pararhizobium sp.]|nr:Gfo/Idh/MocA family oxidoreductase [Pararhizobium sp.]
MTIRIGLIGAGVMGADHARMLSTSVAGADLVAVADADAARAEKLTALGGGACRTFADPIELIRATDVDAVLIASPDETHKPLVLACLEAEKPVLCEKPLARTPADCLEVVAREVELGRRLVQVGFMRRFDPGYVEMRRTVEEGTLGTPLMMHCIHRNESALPYTQMEGMIANTGVHEIDAARFILDDDVARTAVVIGRSSKNARIRDPQLLLMQFSGGAIVDVEIFVNAQYGYDVRAELVCESGTVSLTPPHDMTTLHARREGFTHPADWRPRFTTAYEHELQSWLAAIRTGRPAGASAWDGYAAAATAEAALKSQADGAWHDVEMAERPGLYG